MNENNLMNDSQKKNTYHATTNLNTAIENPQINIDSVVGVNIKDVESSNLVDNYNSNDDIEVIMNNSSFDSNIPNSSFQNENKFQQMDSYFESLNKKEEQPSQFVPNTSVNETDFVSNSENDNIVYEPTMKEKKRHDKKFQISREFKVMIFIVFILFIFILLVPYIYDFFKQLELMVSTG